MRRFRFMSWVVVPLLLALAYAVLGLPHVRWSYAWVDEGRGFDPLAPRFYTSCMFWGPFGQFRIDHPAGGRCAWVIFRKSRV